MCGIRDGAKTIQVHVVYHTFCHHKRFFLYKGDKRDSWTQGTSTRNAFLEGFAVSPVSRVTKRNLNAAEKASSYRYLIGRQLRKNERLIVFFCDNRQRIVAADVGRDALVP